MCAAMAAACLLGAFFFTASADDDEREVRASLQAISNLKVIATAMHSYHDKYNHFPPAYLAGADGKPAHSWRVLLLEFLDQEELLKQYKFDEPWNGPNNRKLADKMPGQYRVSTDPKKRGVLTSYVVLSGAKTAFPGAKTVKIGDIKDGLGNTILVAEAEGFNIHWMEPRDWDVDRFPIQISDVQKPGFSSHNRRGPSVALADAIILRLSLSAPVDQLLGMSTVAGGEKIDLKLISAK